MQPKNGMWNMLQQKLYEPATIKGCVMIIYDREFRKIGPNSPEDAMKRGLLEACTALGILGVPDAASIPVLRKDPVAGKYADVSSISRDLYWLSCNLG